MEPLTAAEMGISPETEQYLISRGFGLPTCPPLIYTGEPSDAPGAVFDAAKVDRAITAMALLPHTQGDWAGQPFVPEPWEVAFIIAPIFGWVAKDENGVWSRVIRKPFFELPKKNGKTTLAARMIMVATFADGEQGAQGYTVAASKDQAEYAFGPIKQVAERAPALAAAGVTTRQNRLVQSHSGSYLALVSALGHLIHGANVHAALVDELHVHKSPDLLNAVETATAARRQPLIIIISNADDGKPHTVYANRRRLIEQLAERTIINHSIFGAIWGSRPDDDPFSEVTWRKANPNYGISVKADFLKAEADKAKQSPAELATFLRFHCGQRTKQAVRYITLQEWDANAGLVRYDSLRGRVAYGGLDLSSTQDTTALCWLLPDDEKGGYDAVWRVWIPEERIFDLDKRTAGAATAWVRQGWLSTTPGNVIDTERVQRAIEKDMEYFTVAEVAFDPWNATDLTNRLLGEGAPMVQVRQGPLSLSAPLKEIKRLLMVGDEREPMIRHGGNPVVRWMVDNLSVKTDSNGNVKPDKEVSADKIDAVSALVTAMARGMHHQKPGRSAYEDEDLYVV